MGMLAQAYPDDEERGSAMGIGAMRKCFYFTFLFLILAIMPERRKIIHEFLKYINKHCIVLFIQKSFIL